MAWDDDSINILRVLISDFDPTTQVNTDDTLLSVLVVGAYQVLREVDTTTAYTVSISAQTITPDPTLGGDDSFINLFCMKSACIMDNGAAIVAANRAIAVKDGTSAVNLEGIFKGKLALLREGWCSAYKDAKLTFIREQSGISRTGVTVAGAVIMTPFRLFARDYYGYGLSYGGYGGDPSRSNEGGIY